jgi:hypothetical protein
MIRWEDLEPETRASIELQPTRLMYDDTRQCGCLARDTYYDKKGMWIYLCQYHEGFDDGADARRMGSECQVQAP